MARLPTSSPPPERRSIRAADTPARWPFDRAPAGIGSRSGRVGHGARPSEESLRTSRLTNTGGAAVRDQSYRRRYGREWLGRRMARQHCRQTDGSPFIADSHTIRRTHVARQTDTHTQTQVHRETRVWPVLVGIRGASPTESSETTACRQVRSGPSVASCHRHPLEMADHPAGHGWSADQDQFKLLFFR